MTENRFMKIRLLLCLPVLALSTVIAHAGKPLKESLAGPGWTFYAEAPIRYSPVTWQGRLYVGSDDGSIYCLEDGDDGGQLVWKLPTDGPVRSSPAVGDHAVYVASDAGFLYCLDEEDAELIFRFEMGGEVYSSPALAGHKLYIGNGSIVCFKE